MKKRTFAVLLAALLAALFLAGCGGSAPASDSLADTSSSGDTIVVGASPAPHAEILELIQPTLAGQGITLEIKVFNDYIVPNTALDDGSIDANYFQHQPYLDDFNVENGTDLVGAARIHIEPLGIYPGRVETLEEMPDGALIGIPNDPTNEGRALALLEALDLITLSDDAGLEAVPSDIVDNPKNLEFIELEAAQLPVTLPDVDFAVINGNYAVEAGLGDTLLAAEDSDSPYVNVLAVRSGDEDRPEIVALIEALQSEEVREFIEERYNGIVVPAF